MYATGGMVVVVAWLMWRAPAVPFLLLGAAALSLACAESFRYLTVEDEGDCLAVRFGPLPLLGTRICYADITAVEAGRSSILDGWGVHWVPGRGTTYNLWGLDCVKVRLGRKVIRIGSDDVENLVGFVRTRMSRPQ